MKGFRGPNRTLRAVVLASLVAIFGAGEVTEAQYYGSRNGVPRELPLGDYGGRTRIPPANQPPGISGEPVTGVAAGEEYDFAPTASDPDGDKLRFSVTNLPRWAQFDPGTGRISGRPSAADVGVYAGISIGVTDGRVTQGLQPFSIQVDAIGRASVPLSWIPPTLNEDGSVLVDLAGYRIFYGRSPGALSRSITIANPGITAFVVENLSSGTWYFAARSFNGSGVESRNSPVISRIAY